ncbi:MAG: hypothetical protein H3C68_03600 [Deltaproteobacteria bacterium]|nr:hypothetical protein [Deltaproteobacteria bacterium]MBZ0219810.1 hypothetical protein [Deltaproteobacteria bacterium]
MLQRKTAGFSIGKNGISAIEVKGNGRLSAVRTWKEASRPDMGGPAGLKDGITKALSESGIGVRRVSVSIPDTLARATVLDFEELPGSKKDAQGIIRCRALMELEADPDKYALSYQAFSFEKGNKVLCVAAERSWINAIEDGFSSSGRRVSRISVHTLNVANLLSAGDPDSAVLTVASDFMAVLVFMSGSPVYYRCKGISNESEAMREALSSFAFYCGKNPGHRISRIALLDETGKIAGMMSGLLPARIEEPGRTEFRLESELTCRDLSLLAAAGSTL